MLGVAVAILVCCATLALLIPLRRPTRVDPAIALRAQEWSGAGWAVTRAKPTSRPWLRHAA